MTPSYADGASFRQALEARLRADAEQRSVPLNTLRQKVVMERLLARLFADTSPGWRLKGGYAMELRLAQRARATRDLDLATHAALDHDAVLEALREAAARDLGDFLVYAIAGPGTPPAGEQPGGYRFAATVMLGGRRYAGFHVDVGLDAEPREAPEVLTCEDHLAFAGLPPARVSVVPRHRQFAEKIHAYTRPWGDRTNTRTKDLVDLLLLIELGLDDREALRDALADVFGRRASHAWPEHLPEPPAAWTDEFPPLAASTGLGACSLSEAFARLQTFWGERALGRSAP